MSNCKNCGKEVEQKQGRRKREFCSDTCRQKHWQAKKTKTPPLEEGKIYSWVGGQLIEVELPNIHIAQSNSTQKQVASEKYPGRKEGESVIDYKIRTGIN